MDDPGIRVNDDKDAISKIINIEEFLKENYNDTISLLKQSNYENHRKPLLVMFHHLRMNGVKYWIDKLYEVALKFPNSIHFAVAELEDSTLFHCSKKAINRFGSSASTEPFLYAIDIDGRQHQYEGSFTNTDELARYCEKLERNEIYESESMIDWEQHHKGKENFIVADNFKELIQENDEKDVHLIIHSNFTLESGFLRHLPDDFKEDSDSIAFYAINASKNYIPLEYKAAEFPRSYFIRRKNRSKPLRCSQYPNAVRCFISQMASTKLKSVDKWGDVKQKAEIDEEQKNIIDILQKFTHVVEKKLPNEKYDDNGNKGFLKFMDSILGKLGDDVLVCDSIKAELLSLASKRVTEVLTAKAEAWHHNK